MKLKSFTKNRRKVICYPLKPGGSKWDNMELLHSLRSVAMHWQGQIDDVYILSSIRPDWLSDKVKFVRADGYMEAMHEACKLGDDILWMNDDIYILKDTDWDYVRSWLREGGEVSLTQQKNLLASKNGWQCRLGQVCEKLRELGKPTWKYSTHTPYHYEADKLKECLDIFGYGYKTPIETAYGNYFNVTPNLVKEKLRRYKPHIVPLDLRPFRYFNHNDAGLKAHTKGFLRGKFPDPCRYEKAWSGDTPKPCNDLK